MTLTITLDTIASTTTSHTARRHLSTGVGTGLWNVSWLPGRLLTRDEAASAMRIADFVHGIGDDHVGHLGQFRTWATSLGLGVNEAWQLAARTPTPNPNRVQVPA